jgi:hypothetical protein
MICTLWKIKGGRRKPRQQPSVIIMIPHQKIEKLRAGLPPTVDPIIVLFPETICSLAYAQKRQTRAPMRRPEGYADTWIITCMTIRGAPSGELDENGDSSLCSLSSHRAL